MPPTGMGSDLKPRRTYPLLALNLQTPSAYGPANSTRLQYQANDFVKCRHGHLRQDKSVLFQRGKAAKLTRGPFAWILGETIFERQDAFSVLCQLLTTLSKNIGTAEMAAAAGDIVGRRWATCTEKADAQEMPRVGITVVEGKQPFSDKESVAEQIVVERVPHNLPEVLLHVCRCARRGHSLSRFLHDNKCRPDSHQTRPLPGQAQYSEIRDSAVWAAFVVAVAANNRSPMAKSLGCNPVRQI